MGVSSIVVSRDRKEERCANRLVVGLVDGELTGVRAGVY